MINLTKLEKQAQDAVTSSDTFPGIKPHIILNAEEALEWVNCLRETKEKLVKLHGVMKDAALEAQKAGCGVHIAVVGCWRRTLDSITEEIK